MKKLFQIIVISAVCLGFGAFLGLSYWFGVKDRAEAQDFSGENQFVCEEPIPIGEAVNVATDFLNQIYKVYQGEQMTTAKNQINGLVGAIDNGGKVCDFNRCEASVATAGPTVKLCGEVGLGVGQKCYKRTIGSCAINDCVANKEGDVCPNLSGYLQGSGALDALANRLDANAQEIHNLFETKNKEVPAGLEKEGQQVSDEELVRIYLNAIERDWLTPNPQKNTCALSELDRKRIEQGLMGDKYPLQCLEALSRDMYTPKPWSETCEKECETFSQECKNCLAKCEGNSVYAQLNCKIYSTGRGDEATPAPTPTNVCFQCGQSGLFDRCQEEECDLDYCEFEPGPISGKCVSKGVSMPTECSQCKTKICCEAMGKKCAFGNQSARVEPVCYENIDPNKEIKVGENKKCALLPKQSKKCCGNLCSDGLNVACKQCLCEGLTQDECLDWICGGSKSNWVCCHEEPIKSPQLFYAANQIFASIDVMETVQTPEGTVQRIISKESRFGETYAIFYKLWKENDFSDIDLTLVMANSYRESKFRERAGGCNLSNKKDGNGDYALVNIKTGKVFEGGFREKDFSPLFTIITPLGLKAENVPLSCPIPERGMPHGGAMGPAQFMPSTWVEKIEGGNPWSTEDAYFAAAVYLQELKEKQGGDQEAIAHYIGFDDPEGEKAKPLVKQTMCTKKIFENQIANGCFEGSEKTNKNPSCNKNLDGYIGEQVKTKNVDNCIAGNFAVKKGILDFLTFWK